MSTTHTAPAPSAPARDSAPAGGDAPSAMAAALASALGLDQGTAAADTGANAPAPRAPRERGANPRGDHPRGPRGRPGRSGNNARQASPRANDKAAASERPARPQRPAPRPTHPVLAKLAELYPALFGDVARPLKRGIFQDLMTAHPDLFEKASLKEALGQYTRSTRYLKAMADNQPRHDLQGSPVEPLALEHAYHALLEVFKRRHARTGEDVRAELQERMVQMLDATQLHRDDFVRRVRTKDEAANELLDAALAYAATRAAKDEALLRAYTQSGLSLDDFASSYGMEASAVSKSLARAALVPSPETLGDAAAAPVAEATPDI